MARNLRPDTFLFTLPDGRTTVRCWQTEREQIRADVRKTGQVILVRSAKDPEVYDRIAPDSVEAAFHRQASTTRHVGRADY